MESLKILEGKPSLNWEYDEEADVLYISVGKPRPAVGTDIGDGVVVRCDDKKGSGRPYDHRISCTNVTKSVREMNNVPFFFLRKSLHRLK